MKHELGAAYGPNPTRDIQQHAPAKAVRLQKACTCKTPFFGRPLPLGPDEQFLCGKQLSCPGQPVNVLW